jgi:hypothetical protein
MENPMAWTPYNIVTVRYKLHTKGMRATLQKAYRKVRGLYCVALTLPPCQPAKQSQIFKTGIRRGGSKAYYLMCDIA